MTTLLAVAILVGGDATGRSSSRKRRADDGVAAARGDSGGSVREYTGDTAQHGHKSSAANGGGTKDTNQNAEASRRRSTGGADESTAHRGYYDCAAMGGSDDLIGDGNCDSSSLGNSVSAKFNNNNAACQYDGGDCCYCTCVDGPTYSCRVHSAFDCQDPNGTESCTDSSVASSSAGPGIFVGVLAGAFLVSCGLLACGGLCYKCAYAEHGDPVVGDDGVRRSIELRGGAHHYPDGGTVPADRTYDVFSTAGASTERAMV